MPATASTEEPLGQRIEIDQVTVVDSSVIIGTNRSLTGTDGEGFASSEAAAAGTTFPAKLAAELFEADAGLTRVYVDQNVVVCTRDGAWEDAAVDGVRGVVESFFLFYPEG